MIAVQPLICGSGALRSDPLHSSILLSLLSNFEGGADHDVATGMASVIKIDKQIMRRLHPPFSEICCVGITSTKYSSPQDESSAPATDVELRLRALFCRGRAWRASAVSLQDLILAFFNK